MYLIYRHRSIFYIYTNVSYVHKCILYTFVYLVDVSCFVSHSACRVTSRRFVFPFLLTFSPSFLFHDFLWWLTVCMLITIVLHSVLCTLPICMPSTKCVDHKLNLLLIITKVARNILRLFFLLVLWIT